MDAQRIFERQGACLLALGAYLIKILLFSLSTGTSRMRTRSWW